MRSPYAEAFDYSRRRKINPMFSIVHLTAGVRRCSDRLGLRLLFRVRFRT